MNPRQPDTLPSQRGTFRDMPLAEYLRRPEVGKSDLDILRRCPLDLFERRTRGFVEKPTPEMEWGSVAHKLILEGRSDFYVRPATYPDGDGSEKPWSGNSKWCKSWLADHADKTKLSHDEANYLNRCHDLVRSHPQARSLIDAATGFEVSMFADDDACKLGLKARADILGPDFIADLKTAADGETSAFSRSMANMRYHVQAALYMRVCERLGIKKRDWFFIVLQKSDPPRINVRRLKPEAIDAGAQELEQDLDLFASCIESGVWPGLCNDSGTIEDIDLPAWVYSRAGVEKSLDVIFGGTTVTL